MSIARQFLLRGLLAGLVAGILCFAVAYVVGEPSVRSAISLEESGGAEHAHGTEPADAGHGDHDETGTVVPRSLQSTLGLLTATAVTGVALGGLVGVLSALALGRFGRLGVRGSTLLVAATGFVTVYVLPFVAYPPNPPAVGQEATIGYRTSLYFTMLAISVIAGVTALLAGRHLARRWGAWYAGLAAVAGYLVVTLVALQLLPTYDEVPSDFPATVLYGFRTASFVTQLSLWSVLGLTLAELTHRLVERPNALASKPPSLVGTGS